ncbi:MAG TPA: hypothetical protein VGQ15_00245, partial [Gaiellaceae bacterium]|nr:hypothetical protein [Gaiellaceae bacterium]
MPSERPADARQELVSVEGLDEVVVGAQEEARDDIPSVAALAGDENDGKVVANRVVQLTKHLVAAEAGQADLEEDEARP